MEKRRTCPRCKSQDIKIDTTKINYGDSECLKCGYNGGPDDFIFENISFKEWLREKEAERNKGVYVGVRFTMAADEDISIFCEENAIPNPIPEKEIHSTLIYSTKYDNIVINDVGEDLGNAEPKKFHIFETQDNKRALVLLIKSEYLTSRHKELMKKYDLTYNFDEYIPHITLSYDIEDFDISNLNIKDLPTNFTINTEYKEDLNINKYKN